MTGFLSLLIGGDNALFRSLPATDMFSRVDQEKS